MIKIGIRKKTVSVGDGEELVGNLRQPVLALCQFADNIPLSGPHRRAAVLSFYSDLLIL
jgi:hypothetical protein